MKKILLIVVVLCVALMIVSLGLGARNDSTTADNADGSWFEFMGDWVDPVPLDISRVTDEAKEASLKCFSGTTVSVPKSRTTCAIDIPESDHRVRTLFVMHKSGGQINVEFAAKGGLPGDPKEVCIADVEDKDCDKCCGRVKLQIPKDGATIGVKCRDTSSACAIRLSGTK